MDPAETRGASGNPHDTLHDRYHARSRRIRVFGSVKIIFRACATERGIPDFLIDAGMDERHHA